MDKADCKSTSIRNHVTKARYRSKCAPLVKTAEATVMLNWQAFLCHLGWVSAVLQRSLRRLTSTRRQHAIKGVSRTRNRYSILHENDIVYDIAPASTLCYGLTLVILRPELLNTRRFRGCRCNWTTEPPIPGRALQGLACYMLGKGKQQMPLKH